MYCVQYSRGNHYLHSTTSDNARSVTNRRAVHADLKQKRASKHISCCRITNSARIPKNPTQPM